MSTVLPEFSDALADTVAAAAGGIVIGAEPDLPESPGRRNDWIAVDLALRPGHSGGPLVYHEGRLLGISTMMPGDWKSD